jgi:hypothetical protein
MLGEVTVEAEDLKPWRVSAVLEPSMQDSPSSDLFPMLRPLSVHVINAEKDRPLLPATRALNLPVRAIVREHVEFQV